MKLRPLAAGLAVLVLTSGLAVAQDMTSEKGKLSYYFGYMFARDLADSGEQIDPAVVAKAVADGLAKRDPAIRADDLRPAVEAFQRRQQAREQQQTAQWDQAAAQNLTRSNQFIAQAKAAQGAQTLPNGVVYRVLEPGNGPRPTAASTVELEVGGPYPFGQRPPQEQKQQMPAMQVSRIEMVAIREVLLQMPVGARWEVTLPPDKAFGNNRQSNFPPNVAVQFEIKLKSAR